MSNHGNTHVDIDTVSKEEAVLFMIDRFSLDFNCNWVTGGKTVMNFYDPSRSKEPPFTQKPDQQ